MGTIITDRKARSIKPDSKPFATGVTGLWLMPTKKEGHGQWILRYMSPVTGKRRDMGLGSFPDTGVARAVEKAREARALIAEKSDPIEARKAQQSVPTFEQAARDHWQTISPTFKNDKHKAQWISSLEQHIFPAIGNRRVDRLDTADFAAVLNKIIAKVPETGKRLRMRSNVVMAACRAKKLIPTNPLEDIAPLLAISSKDAPQTHQPAMPWQSLPAFVKEHLASATGAKAALLFTILTAARSGEVRGATWSEIDLDKSIWTIPASRMKAGVAHKVPLSGQAIVLLSKQARLTGGAGTGLVFEALRGGQLSDMALTSILRKANAVSDIPGRIATCHGFRSSFRNWCADNETSADLAERALAHTINNKVQAAYERTDRFTARVELMQKWADFCQRFDSQNNHI